jgi:hypothetical protein
MHELGQATPISRIRIQYSRSSSTKITLFKALYGFDPELQLDLPSAEDSTITGEAPAAYDRITRLTELQQRL